MSSLIHQLDKYIAYSELYLSLNVLIYSSYSISHFHFYYTGRRDLLDQGKNPKWPVSSYFHSSFSPISSPYGANSLTLLGPHKPFHTLT